MEELPQDQVEKQVHNDPVPAEPEYTLEEIMREFGGAGRTGNDARVRGNGKFAASTDA